MYSKIVLLVFENRTFDNLFGFLPHKVDNLLSRPVTYRVNKSDPIFTEIAPEAQGDIVPQISDLKAPTIPRYDPNEEYQDLYESFTNKPWSLSAPQLSDIRKHCELPMSGFVTNYAKALKTQGAELTEANIRQVVDVVPPSKISVITSLAREFALCDNYFAEVCSNTLVNRAFLQSATSNGMVTNQNYFGMTAWLQNHGATIYDRLAEGKIPFKIYFNVHNGAPTSFLINYPSCKLHKDKFQPLDEFFRDLQNQTLPSFSLIEPRFLGIAQDYHPTDSDSFHDHSSIRGGELLLYKIYNAIRESSLRDDILFLVTFDEGGNLADHVPPPRCKSPYPHGKPTEMKFDFKTLGQRVPMLMIHSRIPKGTVVHKMLHHTSLIKTLCKKFQLPHINVRDQTAPRYPNTSLFTLNHNRAWPSISPWADKDTNPSSGIWNWVWYSTMEFFVNEISREGSRRLFQEASSDDIEKRLRNFIEAAEFFMKWSEILKADIFSTPLCSLRFYLNPKPRKLSPSEKKHREKIRGLY